jgi:hypothetical protein
MYQNVKLNCVDPLLGFLWSLEKVSAVELMQALRTCITIGLNSNLLTVLHERNVCYQCSSYLLNKLVSIVPRHQGCMMSSC